MAVIFPETTLPFSESNGAYVFTTSSDVRLFALNIGDYCEVVWDGVPYTVQAKLFEYNGASFLQLGNISISGLSTEDTGEPFVMLEVLIETTYNYGIYTTSAGETHTISINSENASNAVLAERELSFAYDSNYGVYVNNSSPSLFVPVEGTTYKIVWDGTEYESTAFTNENFPGQVMIGNTILIGGENTNEPYAISSLANGDGMTIFILDTNETHRLAVYLVEDEVPDEPEVPEGIVLKDHAGNDVIYEGIKSISVPTSNGGTKNFVLGNVVEKTVDLAMADGNMVIEANEDEFLQKVTVTKPSTLLPENIAKGVDIGGVVGEFAGSGGGDVDKVTFFDYDGTVVAEYTLEEMQSLTELPEAPEHEGLTFQGWNWTLEEIQSEIAMTETILNVGACYITSDGKTRLYVDINHSSMQKVTMYFSQTVANGVTVDWGDGSTSKRSTSGTGSLSHTYSALGEYVITLDVADGCTFGFGYNSSSYGLFGKDRGSIANILRKVEIGKNVTTVGAYAFYYCYNLATINIPVGVTSIGTYAFHSLKNGVKYVGLPKGLTSIGTYAFYYCFSLAHISIPKGVTSLGSSCFYYCYSLEEIVFPCDNPVHDVGLFSECKSLKTAVNVAIYSSGCNALKKIVYKANTGIIPIKFAYYCYALEKISFREDVVGIGANAFENCSNLKSIQIPEGVISIAQNAFSYCHSLKEVILPKGVGTLGSNVFSGCYSLRKVVLQEGITSIGSYAFNNCASLEEVILPEGLTAIQASTFASCDSLRKIVIPSTVTDIAAKFLSYPYSLREIHFLGETPPTFAGALLNYGSLTNCTFYVPKGTLAAYKSAAYLSTYASQIVEE